MKKIGLVHGRFQPFHNGHKELVDRMLTECDIGVVLIGSANKSDEKNPFTYEDRKKFIHCNYGDTDRLIIGANIDLDDPYLPTSQWDVVWSSCVLSLTGYLPTHVFTGPQYDEKIWKRVKPKIEKASTRKHDLSATYVRTLLLNKDLDTCKIHIPPPTLDLILKTEIYDL